jgi:hypothetical protein
MWRSGMAGQTGNLSPEIGNSDGIDTIGLFNTSDAHFYLRNANPAGNADLVSADSPRTDSIRHSLQ